MSPRLRDGVIDFCIRGENPRHRVPADRMEAVEVDGVRYFRLRGRLHGRLPAVRGGAVLRFPVRLLRLFSGIRDGDEIPELIPIVQAFTLIDQMCRDLPGEKQRRRAKVS